MSFDVDINTILNNLSKNIQANKSAEDLTSDEKQALEELGITDYNDYEHYQTMMAKVNAENEQEREQVREELEKLVKRIKELAPENQYNSIITDLLYAACASNINSIQQVFKLFTDKISELEAQEFGKSEDEKQLEKFLFKYEGYSDQLSINDFNNLIAIIKKICPDANANKNGNKTNITFTYGGTRHTIITNISGIDISDIEKTETPATTRSKQAKDFTTEDYTKVENIIRQFVGGKMNYQDLYNQLKPYLNDILFKDYLQHLSYNKENKGYMFNFVIGDRRYSFTCDAAAVDDTKNGNLGIQYDTFTPSDLSKTGLTQDQISKYFTACAWENGSAVFYIKNKAAWSSINATGDANDLKSKLDSIEQEQNNSAETRGVTNQLTSEQTTKIDTICSDIASKVGLTNTEKEDLRTRLTNRIAELISQNVIVTTEQLDLYIGSEALKFAYDIINERTTKSGNGVDVNDLLSKIENHSTDALGELKAAYDKGLVNITITRDGTSNDYRVKVTSSNGNVEEIFNKNDLINAGFSLQEPDSQGNVSINRKQNNTEYITNDQKNAYLITLCMYTMPAQNTGSSNDLATGVFGLSYVQAMKLYNDLKNEFINKDYNNLDTFKQAVKKRAEELGKKYIEENTAKTRESNSSSSTSNSINIDTPEGAEFMSKFDSMLKANGFKIDGSVDSGDNTKFKIRSVRGKSAGTIEITKSGANYDRNGAEEEISRSLIDSITQLILHTFK